MLPFVIVFILFFIICLVLSIPLSRRHDFRDPNSPADLELEFENVVFSSTDGLRLNGWWIPAGESRRTVILLHGFSGSMDPDLKYAPLFHNHVFNVLMFDFRAHGRSDGKLTSLGALEVRDALGAIQFARARGSRSIGLLGFSMGGRTALMAAAMNPGIQAVISDGGPLRLFTAIRADLVRRKLPLWLAWLVANMILFGGSLRLGVNLFARDPLGVVKQLLGVPVLLIHGGRDPYTLPSELERMRAANINLKVWQVAAAVHRSVDEVEPELYTQNVIRFFEENLK